MTVRNMTPVGTTSDVKRAGVPSDVRRAISMTRMNMIRFAMSVAVTNISRRLVSCLLCSVILAVTAVEETSHPIAPEMRIPHFEPITFARIYPMNSTPAIMTTNFQREYGLKNCIVRIRAVQFAASSYQRLRRIFAKEKLSRGKTGRITSAITANFNVFMSSSRSIFSRIFAR